MRAAVTRVADQTVLYLSVDADGWRVTAVLPSGTRADPAVVQLLGRRLTASAVLAWAAGVRGSADLLVAGGGDG